MARTVWTIGYEGHSPESLVATLRDAGVRLLVDVRDLPLSRRPGFSKKALAEAVEGGGIAYSNIRALGAPKPIRAPYKAGESFATFQARYRKHLAGQEAALADLIEQAKGTPTALLCYEADPAACHRGIMGEELVARGFHVRHL